MRILSQNGLKNVIRVGASVLVLGGGGALADVGQPQYVSGTTVGASPESRVESRSNPAQVTENEPESTESIETDVESSKTTRPPTAFFFNSFLTGPAVADPMSGETVAYIQGNTLGLSVENQIGFRYYLSKELTISPVFDFEYQFTDPHNNGKDKRLALTYDSFVKLYRSNVLAFDVVDNFVTLDVEGRLYVPTSEFSRNNESLGSARFSINPGIQIGDTGFSLFMVNFVRYWIQTRTYEGGRQRTAISLANRSRTLPEWTFYTGPQISYRVNDQITAWVLYETSRTVDTLGISNTSNPRASLADIEPGIDFRLNENITISPYLNWYTKQPLDTTSLNVSANITI